MSFNLFSTVIVITTLCNTHLIALRRIRHPIMTPGGESSNILDQIVNPIYITLNPSNTFTTLTPPNRYITKTTPIIDTNLFLTTSMPPIIEASTLAASTNPSTESSTTGVLDGTDTNSFTLTTIASSIPSTIINNETVPSETRESDSEETDSVIVDAAETGIDLNDGNWWSNFGTTTTQQPSVPVTGYRISQRKCIEYSNNHTPKNPITRSIFQVLIVGGTDASEKEFPHMAALGYGEPNNKQWLCGGSLISERYVITAGHCLNANYLGDVRYVRLGTTTLATETLNSQDFNVTRTIAHPQYLPGKNYNDIALLQLDRVVTFTEFISPICLNDREDLPTSTFIAIGWGRSSPAGSTSKELQKVELDYYPNNVCQETYAFISKQDLPVGISDATQICAGSASGSKDTCQGDSGGPLQFQENGRYILVGITSFGIGCGRIGSPGVYTRVSAYLPWIESIAWNSF